MSETGRQIARAIAGDSMIYFKSCRRCSGDRSLEQDFYGWYVICLSCADVTYPNIEPTQKEVPLAGKAAWTRAQPPGQAVKR